MSKVIPTSVIPSDSTGNWFTEDRRYFDYAWRLLKELEALIAEVKAQLPNLHCEAVYRRDVSPEVWELVRRRDMTSDAVLVFSAISAEAFLNFYGVVRLGQDYFDRHLERRRLGPVAKLKELFWLCEKITLKDSEPLVQLLDRIAKRRNKLVHPKVTEVSGPVSGFGNKLPEEAQQSFVDLEAFFREFALQDTKIAHHLPFYLIQCSPIPCPS